MRMLFADYGFLRFIADFTALTAFKVGCPVRVSSDWSYCVTEAEGPSGGTVAEGAH